MIDLQNETLPPQGPTAQNIDFMGRTEPEPVADVPAVDHHACIRELAKELHNASPSGAATISDKILFHLDAIADPEAYDARQAELKKAEDGREAERKATREKLKAKPETVG